MFPHPPVNSVRYARLWYFCHDGERQAEIIQCQRLPDPTHDQTCIIALNEQQQEQNTSNGSAVPMLGGSSYRPTPASTTWTCRRRPDTDAACRLRSDRAEPGRRRGAR